MLIRSPSAFCLIPTFLPYGFHLLALVCLHSGQRREGRSCASSWHSLKVAQITPVYLSLAGTQVTWPQLLAGKAEKHSFSWAAMCSAIRLPHQKGRTVYAFLSKPFSQGRQPQINFRVQNPWVMYIPGIFSLKQSYQGLFCAPYHGGEVRIMEVETPIWKREEWGVIPSAGP